MISLSRSAFMGRGFPSSISGTAGNSSAVTSSGILAIITFVLFLFYDYASGIRTNNIFFKSLINDK